MRTRPPTDAARLDRHRRAPVQEMCERFVRERLKAPFYTPGHKGGRSLPEGFLRSLVDLDICNLPDTDTLACPTGALREAEELMAEAWGARHSFLLVNGSTGGNIAALVAAVGPGDTVLVQRNSHKSILAGLVHCGARPVWLRPTYDVNLGIAHGVTTEHLRTTLDAHPTTKAVVLLNPTYFGTTAPLAELVALAHDRGVLVIADEAHGPHFHFHEQLPAAALDVGADIVVQSTHKILSGLSQGSVLHLGSERIDEGRMRSTLAMLQTTSPHFAILTSLDLARRQVMLEGHDRLSALLAGARRCRGLLDELPGVSVLSAGAGDALFHALDPTKIVLDVAGLRASGLQVQRRLNQLGVQPELASASHVLCVLTLGTVEADLEQLVAGLRAVASDVGLTRRHDTQPPRASIRLTDLVRSALSSVLVTAMTPRDAFFARNHAIAAVDAKGRVAAETITPYPPGIPIVMPGEVFDGGVLEMLEATRAAGCPISAADPTLQTFRVVE